MARLLFLRLSTALLLVSCAVRFVAGQDETKKEPFHDEKTGLVFEDVNGFERLDTHHFKGRGLGYSVDYRSKSGIRISVYVYDFELPEIPDGPFSPLIKQQYENSKRDIIQAKEQGAYQEAEELANEVIVLGEDDEAPKLRKATFRVRRSDKDWISYIYLTGYKKHFLKVRSTLPADNRAACEKEAAAVLAQLGKMLRSAEPE